MIEQGRANGSDGRLVAIAAYGLAGSMIQLPVGTLVDDEWSRLVDACRTHGLLGMLSAARHEGDVALSTTPLDEFAGFDKEMSEEILLLEREVVRWSELMSERGVAHRLLGGLPVRRSYRAPQLRSLTSDTVLLTAPEAAGAAIAQPAVSATLRAAGLDIGVADLADPPVMLEIAGGKVPTARLEEHLVLACMRFHTSPSLLVQRDIAELALSPATTVESVQKTAVAWGVSSIVTRALTEVWRGFELADKTRLSVWAARSEARQSQSQAPSGALPGQALGRRTMDALGRLMGRRGPAPATRRYP